MRKIVWLLLLMFLVFGLGDMMSTLVAYYYLGCDMSYEAGLAAQLFYSIGGVPFFIVGKLVAVAAIAYSMYLMSRNPDIVEFCEIIASGVIVAGAFVSISNLKVAFYGESIWIFGIGADKITIGILFGSLIIGMLYQSGIFHRIYNMLHMRNMQNILIGLESTI